MLCNLTKLMSVSAGGANTKERPKITNICKGNLLCQARDEGWPRPECEGILIFLFLLPNYG
jgi:hypothetical protein